MTGMLHVVCPHCDAANRLPSGRLGGAPKCGRCQKLLFTGEPVALDSALIVFVGGKIAAQQAGLSDAARLRSWVDRLAPVQA